MVETLLLIALAFFVWALAVAFSGPRPAKRTFIDMFAVMGALSISIILLTTALVAWFATSVLGF